MRVPQGGLRRASSPLTWDWSAACAAVSRPVFRVVAAVSRSARVTTVSSRASCPPVKGTRFSAATEGAQQAWWIAPERRLPCGPGRSVCAGTVTSPYTGGLPAGMKAARPVTTCTPEGAVSTVLGAMARAVRRTLKNVIAPRARLASWCQCPVARAVVVCASVSGPRGRPWKESVVTALRSRLSGVSVTVAGGARKAGRKKCASRTARQTVPVATTSREESLRGCGAGASCSSGATCTVISPCGACCPASGDVASGSGGGSSSVTSPSITFGSAAGTGVSCGTEMLSCCSIAGGIVVPLSYQDEEEQSGHRFSENMLQMGDKPGPIVEPDPEGAIDEDQQIGLAIAVHIAKRERGRHQVGPVHCQPDDEVQGGLVPFGVARDLHDLDHPVQVDGDEVAQGVGAVPVSDSGIGLIRPGVAIGHIVQVPLPGRRYGEEECDEDGAERHAQSQGEQGMPAQAAATALPCLRVPGRRHVPHGAAPHNGCVPGARWLLILPLLSHVIACLPARGRSVHHSARGQRVIFRMQARVVTRAMTGSGPRLGDARPSFDGLGLLGDLFAEAVPGHMCPPRWGEGPSCGVGDPCLLGRETAT